VALSGRVRDLTAGKGYRLSAAQVPERLYEELKQGAAATAVHDGLSDFQFSTREEVNHAVDLLRAERCDIEAVIPTTSTLEEIFVKTVDT
jgi:ABC-type sulfate transport system substrate-binding protein